MVEIVHNCWDKEALIKPKNQSGTGEGKKEERDKKRNRVMLGEGALMRVVWRSKPLGWGIVWTVSLRLGKFIQTSEKIEQQGVGLNLFCIFLSIFAYINDRNYYKTTKVQLI